MTNKDKYVAKGQNKNVKKKKSSLLASNFPGSQLLLREHTDLHKAPPLWGEGTSPVLSPPGIKQGPRGHEAIIWPLLALRLRLPRLVLISVPKYMGSYVSYFSVEIQALHLKIRHIYWNNTPARVRRRKLGICLGALTLFSLNGKSSRRCCQE